MIYAFTILSFAIAILAVKYWKLKRELRAAIQLNRELLEMNAEQQKTLDGARVIAKIAARGMREREEKEWPSEIG